MAKVVIKYIKPWEREEYPGLKTKTELKKRGLMPVKNAKPRAVVERPEKYGGDYYLYDEKLVTEYKESKAYAKYKRQQEKKRRDKYTCRVCGIYLGARKIKNREIVMWGKSCTSCYLKQFVSIPKEKILCFDIETTGLSVTEDEILQLSVINGNGEVLFDKYIKPENITEWPDAEDVNNISYEKVKDEKHFSEYIEVVQALINNCELVLGYNSSSFDIPILENHGISISSEKKICDMMIVFSELFGEWDFKKRRIRYQSLSDCAAYCGYVTEESFHNAKEDARATLYCFWKICETFVCNESINQW